MPVLRRIDSDDQNGQAMVEFAVVASLVLIPLLLLVPILGKQIDINHKTIQAARYEAWEYTVWNKDNSVSQRSAALPQATRYLGYKEAIPEKKFADVKTEANYRFYSEPGSTISRNDMEKVSFAVNPLWKDHKGTQLLGLDATSKVTDELTPDLTAGATGVPLVTGFMDLIGKGTKFIAGLVSKVTDAGFSQIDMKGKFVGKSRTTIPALSWAKGSYDNALTTNRQAAVMSLAWSAGGKKHARYQTRGLVATSLLDITGNSPLLEDVISILSAILVSPELSPKWLEFGYTGDDTVPADRLFKGSKQGKIQCGQLSSYNYARSGKPDSDKLGIFTPDSAREIRTDTTLTGDAAKFYTCSSTLP